MTRQVSKSGKCKVCAHPDRERIEALRAEGTPLEPLAEKFGLSRSSLHRHWTACVSADRRLTFLVGKSTIAEMRARAAEENLSLLDYLGIVRSALTGQLVAQAEAGAAMGVATVAGRLLDVLREIGRITGEIERVAGPSIHVHNNVGIIAAPGFADLQAGLLQIARDHPGARADIMALFDRLNPASAPPRGVAPLLIQHEAAHG